MDNNLYSKKKDGRTLRKSNKTERFSTNVTPKFKSDLHSAALLTGKNYNEILEDCLSQYISNIKNSMSDSSS